MNSSRLRIDEFSSSIGDITLYYHVLHLEESVYVWIGTESGQMSSLIGAFHSRVDGAPPAISNILGPINDGQSCHLAERLQHRIGKNIFLSANLPDEALSLHAEEQLICHLSA